METSFSLHPLSTKSTNLLKVDYFKYQLYFHYDYKTDLLKLLKNFYESKMIPIKFSIQKISKILYWLI